MLMTPYKKETCRRLTDAEVKELGMSMPPKVAVFRDMEGNRTLMFYGWDIPLPPGRYCPGLTTLPDRAINGLAVFMDGMFAPLQFIKINTSFKIMALMFGGWCYSWKDWMHRVQLHYFKNKKWPIPKLPTFIPYCFKAKLFWWNSYPKESWAETVESVVSDMKDGLIAPFTCLTGWFPDYGNRTMMRRLNAHIKVLKKKIGEKK